MSGRCGASERSNGGKPPFFAFLVSEKGMSRDDAYMLISVAGDVEVTELVDRNKGVHVVLPKKVFAAR